MRINRKSNLSLCVSLFLFQYSLLMPVMRHVAPSLVVGVSGITILVFLFISESRNKLSIPVVLLILAHTIIVSVRVLLGDSISLLAYGLMVPLPALVLFVFDGDLSEWLDKAIVLAALSFVINCWIPFSKHYEYMRFGYGMILSTVVGIIYAQCRWHDLSIYKRVLVVLLIAASGMESLLYGPRGCVIVVSLCVFQLMFLVSEAISWKNASLLIIGTVALYRVSDLVDALSRFVSRIGINSYSINKFKMQLEKGVGEASSGRADIYSRTIKQIVDSPIFGHRIESIGESGDYAHDLFLQVGLDWGILGIAVLLMFLILVFLTVVDRDSPIHERLLMVVLFSTSVGRLLFSSTYWLRPEFWMMAGFTMWTRNKRLSRYAEPCYHLRHGPPNVTHNEALFDSYITRADHIEERT